MTAAVALRLRRCASSNEAAHADRASASTSAPWPVTAFALLALRRGDAEYGDVIAWMSEHLAAFGRVLRPVVGKALVHRPELLAAEEGTARDLADALLQLHSRLSGDGNAMHLSPRRLQQRVDALLSARLTAETALVAALPASARTELRQQLAVRYEQALTAAPTRPHPHAPQHGWAGRLAFTILARTDQVRDGLASRVVQPLPVPAPLDSERAAA
jgi:hypothetical protein